ncbi:TENX-like protein, partial [Mya arenaria]
CWKRKCNNDGTCDCVENFEGNKCDICVQGKYGELCNNTCNNTNYGCTNATNFISCKSGYFAFSTYCLKQCSLGCKDNCNNEGHCSCHFTCENCKPGNYGYNCNIPCTHGCINGTCNRDGSCSCLPTFTGARCETCVAGYYGDFCDKPCGLGCKGNFCNRDNGKCICESNFKGAICDICNDGYFGVHCILSCPDSIALQLACKERFYDLDCSNNCSVNCLGSRCKKDNGFCTDGCIDGFTAATCNDRCEKICETGSQTNSSHCTSCFGKISGPGCKCIPNCQCELNEECNQCLNGFTLQSKDCKCNRKYCIESSSCTACQNDTSYTFDGTCCECNTLCKNNQCLSENQCLNDCGDGYTVADCANLCTDYYNDCTKCSQNEHVCVQCESGLTPNTDGVCAVQCSDTCVNKECNAKTGRCLQGCIFNFYADKCDLVCPSTCASVPNITRSDNYGRCLHGCIEGYNGITCINATTTNTCDSSAAGIIVGAVGSGSTIIIVIIEIVLCIQRRYQQKKQSESGSQIRLRNPNPFIIEEQERHYQQLSDRQNETAGSQEETYTELETNNMDYERVDS